MERADQARPFEALLLKISGSRSSHEWSLVCMAWNLMRLHALRWPSAGSSRSVGRRLQTALALLSEVPGVYRETLGSLIQTLEERMEP